MNIGQYTSADNALRKQQDERLARVAQAAEAARLRQMVGSDMRR